MMIGEVILGWLSLPPEQVPTHTEDSPEASPTYPLGLLEAEYPDLPELLRGKHVLDFGCGFGYQTAVLAKSLKYQCASAQGLEINPSYFIAAQRLHPGVTFIDRLPGEKYDVVISQDSMEHFYDPEARLRDMMSALRPGGHMLITFGPPWFSPWGSHMHFFCRMPWVNILFREKTVMTVRSRYRQDGARRYEDVESGLNKMSVRKFERIVRACHLEVVQQRYGAFKRLNFLTRIPLIRELCTIRVTVVLRRPEVPRGLSSK